ncbi:MAG: sigma-70 family RNA polymerase sigma factor [Pirellulales bacterium]
MPDSPLTRPSLLLRIRDCQDAEAWSQFVEIYAPLVYGLARRSGLQDADAADVVQDVMRVLPRAAKRLDYDPQRDSFRGWLFTIARNKLRDFLASRRRAAHCANGVAAHEHLLQNQPATSEDEDFWNREYEEQVFAYAASQVRQQVEPATWQAFWRVAVQGEPAKSVAEELGMSIAGVYVAKSRIIARLREKVVQLRDE